MIERRPFQELPTPQLNVTANANIPVLAAANNQVINAGTNAAQMMKVGEQLQGLSANLTTQLAAQTRAIDSAFEAEGTAAYERLGDKALEDTNTKDAFVNSSFMTSYIKAKAANDMQSLALDIKAYSASNPTGDTEALTRYTNEKLQAYRQQYAVFGRTGLNVFNEKVTTPIYEVSKSEQLKQLDLGIKRVSDSTVTQSNMLVQGALSNSLATLQTTVRAGQTAEQVNQTNTTSLANIQHSIQETYDNYLGMNKQDTYGADVATNFTNAITAESTSLESARLLMENITQFKVKSATGEIVPLTSVSPELINKVQVAYASKVKKAKEAKDDAYQQWNQQRTQSTFMTTNYMMDVANKNPQLTPSQLLEAATNFANTNGLPVDKTELLKIAAQIQTFNSPDIQDALKTVTNLAEAGDYSAAKTIAEKIFASNPTHKNLALSDIRAIQAKNQGENAKTALSNLNRDDAQQQQNLKKVGGLYKSSLLTLQTALLSDKGFDVMTQKEVKTAMDNLLKVEPSDVASMQAAFNNLKAVINNSPSLATLPAVRARLTSVVDTQYSNLLKQIQTLSSQAPRSAPAPTGVAASVASNNGQYGKQANGSFIPRPKSDTVQALNGHRLIPAAAKALGQANNELKKILGADISIASAYRTQAHNASPTVQGSPTSNHMLGASLDINFELYKDSPATLGKIINIMRAHGFEPLDGVPHPTTKGIQWEDNHFDFVGVGKTSRGWQGKAYKATGVL